MAGATFAVLDDTPSALMTFRIKILKHHHAHTRLLKVLEIIQLKPVLRMNQRRRNKEQQHNEQFAGALYQEERWVHSVGGDMAGLVASVCRGCEPAGHVRPRAVLARAA